VRAVTSDGTAGDAGKLIESLEPMWLGPRGRPNPYWLPQGRGVCLANGSVDAWQTVAYVLGKR
jgi:hypothetical protein